MKYYWLSIKTELSIIEECLPSPRWSKSLKEQHNNILGVSYSKLLIFYAFSSSFYLFSFGSSWQIKKTNERYLKLWINYPSDSH